MTRRAALLGAAGRYRAAAGTFLPDTLSGLQGWWRADSITSPPADGATLTTWTDSSSAARNFTQATAGSRPTYRTSGAFLPNGKPVVEFTSASATFMAASSVTTNGDLTRLVVLRAKTIPGAAATASPLLGVGGHALAITDGGKVSTAIDGVAWISQDLGAATLVADRWYILTVTDTTNDDIIYVDGAVDSEVTSGHAAATATTMAIGGKDASSFLFDGYIAEAFDYNRVLSATERGQVHNYLATKYGITLAGAATAYRYYRFAVTAKRDGTATPELQLSEFAILTGTTRLTGMTISATNNSSPTGEEPDKAGDNNTATKWLNNNGTPSSLVYDFTTAVSATGYRWATGNDATNRDPISWTVDGSNDGSSWTTLDTITGYDPTATRSTFNPDFPFGGGGTTPSGIYRNFDMDTSENQASPVVGWEVGSAHQHAWITSRTRLGAGHSERMEIHNNTSTDMLGTLRALMSVGDTNDGGVTSGSIVGYPDVYWAWSSYLPTSGVGDADATVTAGFSQTAIPDYEHLFEFHQRANINGNTVGINNLNEVADHAVMVRGGQLQYRVRCGSWTWNSGTNDWNRPSWNTFTPGTNGSADQIPIPIVKAGATNATMVMNTWIDIIVHVRFRTDSTGLIEVWARTAGQTFTTAPNLTITGPTQKSALGSDGVTRTTADVVSGQSGAYVEVGLYTGGTTWSDASNGAHVHIFDEMRRWSTLAEAKANWG